MITWIWLKLKAKSGIFRSQINSKTGLIIILTILVLSLSSLIHSYHLSMISWAAQYSDILPFYNYFSGNIPYITKKIEYPIITGMFIYGMTLLGKTIYIYYAFTSIFIGMFAIISSYYLNKIADKHHSQSRMMKYWILAPSLIYFSVYNWDILAIMFVILSFYMIDSGKKLWSAFFLSLGFCAKFYPIIYMLPLLFKSKDKKEAIKICSVFFLSAAIINLPFAVTNYENWIYFFRFNSCRSPNMDSIWHLTLKLINLPIPLVNLIAGVSYAAVSIAFVIKFIKKNYFYLDFVLTVLFLLINKVFSPQYALWLLPFFVLNNTTSTQFYGFEIANLIVAIGILHAYFNDTTFVLPWLFVIIRHMVLIWILISLLYKNRKQ